MPIKYTGPGQAFVPDKPQQAPKYTDQNRPLGSRSVLGGRQVVWAGPDWRWQSPASYQRLQSTGKLNRSPFSNPLGAIKNEIKYIGKQIADTNRRNPQGFGGRVRQAVTGSIPGLNVMNALPTIAGQSGRNINAALTVGAAENAGKLAVALGQKLRGKPANPEGSRAGNFIERVSQAGYRVMGATPPGQQNEFERGLDATARSAGTSVIGTAAAVKAVPAIGVGATGAVITGGARWAAGELLSTFADDNRPGNLANLGDAFGKKLPLSVDVGEDDWIDSAIKSLIPNALPGVAISGVGEAAAGLTRNPGIISTLRNSKRWTASNRKVAEITDARAQLEQAGVTVTDPDTGAIALRTSEIEAEAAAQAEIDRWIGGGGEQPPAAPALPAAEPTAAPALPAAPARAADAPEAQISLELDAQPPKAAEPDATGGGQLEVEGVEDSPFDMIYDPELPEADVVFNLVRDLDDDQLQMLVTQPGPVVEQLDQMLQQRQTMPVRPELEQGAVMAPGENIAERLGPDGQPIPYEATLEAMPMDTLRSVAAPDNNPELSQLIGDLTGRDWEEFTKADIIEGLAAYQQQTGQSLLVRDWNQGMRPTAEIAADPERFQFKQGVNEQGEQLGNSLAGVNRWDTNAEGALDVWTDPADGRTYVVNGHNRLARAQQLGIPTVPVRELPAATAQEARAMGALSNIKAGQGTVFDAAKFMRDSGITSPEQLQQMGVPMSSGNAARGLALAQLPDNIFQAAVDGRLSVGKAAALGGSGLDETQMQKVWNLYAGRDMSDAKFAENVAQVRSAPVVQGDQVDLFGNTEMLSLIDQKSDLVVKIRQDLLKDKRFFSTAAKGADRLEQAGNTINVAGNKAIAADTTQVLAMFDELKYAPGPVSDLLNDGARQIAEGAKPGVIADRIRGDIAEAVRRSLDEQGMPTQRPAGAARADGGFDLEAERADSARATQEADALFAEAEGLLAGMQENTSRMAEGARRMLEVSAGIEDIDGALPTDRIVPGPRALSPEERAALQIQAVQKAADQAEIRPPETPIPELPDGPSVRPDVARADLEARGQLEPGSPAAQAAADELRLGLEFAERDAQMQAIAREGARDAMDYELLTFEQKKAMGMADGYDAGPSIAEMFEDASRAMAQSDARLYRAAGERLQRIKGLVNDLDTMEGDPALAPAPVRPEPMKLVDVPPASVDTRGKGEFYHGAANEFELEMDGEFVYGDGMSIYGLGFYATDDLSIAASYKKKNRRLAPADASAVIYRVAENEPVKFYDLDKPAPKSLLSKLRKTTSHDGLELLEQAIEEAGEKASLAEIMDEMRGWSREFDLPAYEVQEIFQGFIDALKKDGYGGFTHVGGNKAGKGKRNHQVRIYWDPAERITIEKVEPSMAEPRTKAADQAARKQIETNNQRMDEIRRQAQQEGC
jgi:hypothetical protein